MLFVNLLGFTASIISFVMFLPQARSTWQHRNSPKELQGVSAGTQYLILVNATIWAVYGVLTGAYWSAAPGLVNFPLALATLFFLHRGRKNLDALNENFACGGDPDDHLYFVKEPNMRGQVIPCPHSSPLSGYVVPAGSYVDTSSNMLCIPLQDEMRVTNDNSADLSSVKI